MKSNCSHGPRSSLLGGPSQIVSTTAHDRANDLVARRRRHVNDWELGLLENILATSVPTRQQVEKLSKVERDVADRLAGKYGRRLQQRGFRDA